MKNTFVLVFLTFLVLQCNHGPQNASMTAGTNQEARKTGTANVHDT